MINRRQWILLAGASGATLTLGKLSTAEQGEMEEGTLESLASMASRFLPKRQAHGEDTPQEGWLTQAEHTLRTKLTSLVESIHAQRLKILASKLGQADNT